MAAAGPESAFPISLEVAGKEILDLVSTSDLSELTSAKVRVHLKTKFGVDFEAYKKKINDLTRDAIEQIQKKKNSSKDDSDDSDSDDEPDGKADNDEVEENGARTNKADSSDSDSDPGIVSTDRKLKGKKTKKSSDSHEYADMVSNIKTSRRAAASKAKDSIKKSAGFAASSSKSKKRGAEEDAGPKIEGKVGRMTKLVYCTPLLQEITGKAYMKRCDVVKVMWDYIKANNLQDAKNKSIVRCDSKLEAITKRKTFKGFGMTKHLVNHVIMPKDMGPEYEAEAQEALDEMIVDYERRVKEANGEPNEKKAKTEENDEEEKEEVKEDVAEESDDEQESDSDSD